MSERERESGYRVREREEDGLRPHIAAVVCVRERKRERARARAGAESGRVRRTGESWREAGGRRRRRERAREREREREGNPKPRIAVGALVARTLIA